MKFRHLRSAPLPLFEQHGLTWVRALKPFIPVCRASRVSLFSQHTTRARRQRAAHHRVIGETLHDIKHPKYYLPDVNERICRGCNNTRRLANSTTPGPITLCYCIYFKEAVSTDKMTVYIHIHIYIPVEK